MTTVMVVEDDPADARLVVEAFRRARGVLCVPNHVETLAAAVEWVRESPCDVILLDLSLPDSRGVETLQGMLRVAGDAPGVLLLDAQHQIVATTGEDRIDGLLYAEVNGADPSSAARAIWRWVAGGVVTCTTSGRASRTRRGARYRW